MSRIEGLDEAAGGPARVAESLGIGEPEFHRRRRRAGLRHIRRHWSRARGWSVRRPHQGLGGHLFGGRPLRPALAVREAGPRPLAVSDGGSATTSTCRPYVPACPPGGFRTQPPSLPNSWPTWRSTPRC